MKAEERWASPVVRPRPPQHPRQRRNSIPAGLEETKTESQADEKSVLPGNSAVVSDDQNQEHVVPTRAGISGSVQDCRRSDPDYGEIKPGTLRQRTNQRRAYSKSFSSGDSVRGESAVNKHRLIEPPRIRSVSNDCSWEVRVSHDSDWSMPSSSTWQSRHHHRPISIHQADDGSLPGSVDRRRPLVLLKQRGRTPALSVDDGATFSALPTPPPLSPPQTISSVRSNAVSDSPGQGGWTLSGSATRRTRRLSSAGEWATPVPPHGSHPRTTNSRNRRMSTSMLPTIANTPPTPNTANPTTMSTLVPSQHGVGSRKLLAAPGGLQSRSLPEDESETIDDLNSVHDFQLLTRKKKLNSNVSQEYRLAMGDLKLAGSRQTPNDGKQLLSMRWSTLQSSILSNKNAESVRARGDDPLSSTGSSSDLSRDDTLDARDDADGSDTVKPPSRGWSIVRANLKTIADMAPKDSIDSKPLNFRNIADLVKAKEFRLMMKRRTSFIENGRFQFDEAKQDLYRRYGRVPPKGSTVADSHHGKKLDGVNKNVNRRKLMGVSGSV